LPVTSRTEARSLAWSRIALGALFLCRTTPLLAPLRLPFTLATSPLLGWPSAGWHGRPAFGAAPAWTIAAACLVRTVAALCFLLGYRTTLFGLLAGVSGYFVLAQYPFALNATLHLLFQGTMLLALTDAGAELAVRPELRRGPHSGIWLMRVFVSSIYFWAAFVKLRPDWLDGRTLGLFHENGIISGPFANFVLHSPWRRAFVARSIVATELSLPILLCWSKTLRWAPLLALAMHATIEFAARPDLLGWEMAALLLCLWPAKTPAPGTELN
jgi:Vitamin K-dependent gamma-carboxylase